MVSDLYLETDNKHLKVFKYVLFESLCIDIDLIITHFNLKITHEYIFEWNKLEVWPTFLNIK